MELADIRRRLHVYGICFDGGEAGKPGWAEHCVCEPCASP